MVHLRQQGLTVGLVGLDDALQFLHEEQLQHALVRVQIHQLEQRPLQDVVIPGAEREDRFFLFDNKTWLHVTMVKYKNKNWRHDRASVANKIL